MIIPGQYTSPFNQEYQGGQCEYQDEETKNWDRNPHDYSGLQTGYGRRSVESVLMIFLR